MFPSRPAIRRSGHRPSLSNASPYPVSRAAHAAAKELREELLDEAEGIAGCAPVADAPQGAVWTEADLAGVEDLGSLLHEGLSEQQLMLLADEHLRRSGLPVSDDAASPETEPQAPNAPNN